MDITCKEDEITFYYTSKPDVVKKAIYDLLIKKLSSILGEHKFISTTTACGVLLTLHVAGKRPTVYHAKVLTNDKGFANTVSIETLSCADEGTHIRLTKKYTITSLYKFINKFIELSMQKATGTKEDTLKNFKNIGLLYIVKS
jgi:hypothetical protein